MGAPFGSKNALGNKGGAPEKYSMEWLEEEADRLMEWMQQEDSIFFKSFAISRGYSAQRLSEFAEKSIKFSEALELAKSWQECKLINFGLFNKVNSTICRFVLTNCHSYAEKTQVTGDAANPLSFLLAKVDGSSKDLLNDSNRE